MAFSSLIDQGASYAAQEAAQSAETEGVESAERDSSKPVERRKKPEKANGRETGARKSSGETSGKSKSNVQKGSKKKSSGPTISESANAIFTSELKKYVSDGMVDYAGWKNDQTGLNNYLAALSRISKSEYDEFSADEKLIFWINAYNAYTIKLVLDHYPIKGTKSYYPASSIRQIEGFWEDNRIDLLGKKVTLEGMEHDILRRDFQEPRVHFAVVPAAKGCGRLRSEAYSVRGLNEALEENTIQFLSNPKNVRFDTEKNLIYVSQLFKWFPLDFANVVGLGKRFPPPTDDEIVAAYILMKTPEAVQKNLSENGTKKFRVVYQEYDWSLNDTSTQPVGEPLKEPAAK